MVQDASRAEESAAGGVGTREKRLGFFGRIALFFRQVIAELRKVVTPTRKELVTYTSVVLVFVLIMMGLVYGLDFVASWLATQVFGVPGR